MQALRGVTIDAAWALRIEDQVGSIVAGKRADFCVLEDDPFELGVDRLKDVRIAGTVFEGQPHMLAQPQAASLGALAAMPHAPRVSASSAPSRHRYRPVAGACANDFCDVGRLWTALFGRGAQGLQPV